MFRFLSVPAFCKVTISPCDSGSKRRSNIRSSSNSSSSSSSSSSTSSSSICVWIPWRNKQQRLTRTATTAYFCVLKTGKHAPPCAWGHKIWFRSLLQTGSHYRKDLPAMGMTSCQWICFFFLSHAWGEEHLSKDKRKNKSIRMISSQWQMVLGMMSSQPAII